MWAALLGVLIVGLVLLAVVWVRISLFFRGLKGEKADRAGRENVRVIRRGDRPPGSEE